MTGVANADGILIRGHGLTLRDLKGKTILLVENSVSHYLLGRALELANFSESEVKIQSISDKAIVQAFIAGQGDAVGMSYAKGITSGAKGNLKLRFEPTYMQMAADGKL